MITVTVDDRQVLEALERLRASAADLRPVLEDIGQALTESARLTFHDARDPYGRPWAPLTELTVSRRREGSAVPLRDTGRLMNSLTYRADADSVEVGTNVIYAGTHQFGARQGAFGRTRRGGPIPWGDIPARPFLPTDGLPEEQRREVLDLIRDHFARAVGG
jgi:phage virion morphogenesis protein